MESQFISPYPGPLLGDLSFTFPPGTHAIGRLDKNSEGLLLLTTNKKITRLLFNSEKKHSRTYLVQVNYKMSMETLNQLRTGVSIRIHNGEWYTTPPCVVEFSEAPPDLHALPRPLSPYVPYTWITISLTEGKFHQVRKMVMAVKHRCLRLIRISIEDLPLGRLQPGEVNEVDEILFFEKLHL